MKTAITFQLAALFGVFATTAAGALPTILSLQADGRLTWTTDYTNGVAVIESTTTMKSGSFAPFFYALAYDYVPVTLYSPEQGNVLTNYGGLPTNDIRVTQLPALDFAHQFYRIALQTNPPDPTLVVHLPFDNDFSHGVILDASGHNNHALQYSPTNWPWAGTGPDGSRAATYGGSRPMAGSEYTQGDYAGIPYSASYDHLTNGTVLAWAYYGANSYHNSTIVDNSCYGTDYASWSLGRTYTYNTLFEIGIGHGQNANYVAIQFPDSAPGGGATGAWHYYGVTWDGTNIIGYFDGVRFSTNSQAGFPELVIGTAGWMAVGCKVHGGNPQWGDPDGLPNWGWIGGKIDDVRIYKRALKPAEIRSLYVTFDTKAPTPPSNLRVKVDSDSQVELRWDAATDTFGIDGYRILRDGTPLGTNFGPWCYVDTGLSPNTAYTYTVQAFDPGRNLSSESAPVQVTTSPAGSSVEVIVDNTDGPPWIIVAGGPWTTSTSFSDFYGEDYLQGDSSATSSVEFRPSIPEAGDYQVYLWHPGNGFWYLFSAAAPVDIVHGVTTNTVYVNEQVNHGRWDLIGTFSFSAGTNNVIRIRPPSDDVSITADALKFVK